MGSGRSAVSGAVVIGRFELLRRVRNRSALFTAFIGPLSLAVVFSLLIGGGSGVEFHIGLADEDRSALSSEIVAGMAGPDEEDTGEDDGSGTVEFVSLEDREAAFAAVEDDDLDAAIVLPAGYGDAVGAGDLLPIDILRDPSQPIAAEVARAIAGSIALEIERTTLATTAVLAGDPGLDPAAVVDAVRAAPAPFTSVEVSMGEGEVDAGAYYGVSMAVLFLFFTVGLAARAIVAERRSGTLPRVLSTPVSMPSVIAGKTGAVALLGLAGFMTVWAVTSIVFGSDWGSSVAVMVLMLATVFAVGGVAMFVAAMARSEQQAETYTAMVAFLLAVLGGNFIGPGNAPPLLDRLSLLTPNGWALGAFTDVSVDRVGVGGVLPALVVLVTMGLIFGLVAVVTLNRRGLS